MESSGMWYNIYECLRKRHLDVRLSNPAKTRAIASAKIKTDKLDSIKLADLLRGGYIAECYVPTKETFIAMTVSWLLIRIAYRLHIVCIVRFRLIALRIHPRIVVLL